MTDNLTPLSFHEQRVATLQDHLTEVWDAASALNSRAEIVCIGVLCHTMLAHDPEAHTVFLEPSDQDDNARFEGWSQRSATAEMIDCDHAEWDDTWADEAMWHLASSLNWRDLSLWGFASETNNGTRISFSVEEALTWLADELGKTFDTPSDLTPAGIEAWLANRKES